MTYTYTNRKGFTYYLCQGTTKSEKIRYYFAREPKAAPVKEIPGGYRVEESVNGIVSLVKAVPQVIFPEELVVVEAAIKKLPKGYLYRAAIRKDQIVVYENRVGDFSEIASKMGFPLPTSFGAEFNESHAQYIAIMRFILENPKTRIFAPQRWCFRGSIDNWIHAGSSATINQLAEELIPALGTDEFFELF